MMAQHPALWRVVWPFGLAYALSYGLRNINATISPALVADLGLGPDDLGLLASAYFLSFACMQLPLGALLDRYGPVRVESILLLFSALGCALSALSESLSLIWLGRALIGLGVSACLMASYKAFRMVYVPGQQAMLGSVMLVLGTLGALMTTLPVQWLLGVMSWRSILGLLGLLFLAASACLVWLLPKLDALRPQPTGQAFRLWPEVRDGLTQCMGHAEFRRLLPFALFCYGGYLGIQGLWMGPWLRVVEGLDAEATALTLGLLMAVALLGHLSTAALAHRYAQTPDAIHRFMVLGLALMSLFAGLAITQVLPLPGLAWALSFFCAGVTTLGYSRFALAFPPEASGRATTALNFAIFSGGFLVQWGLGVLIRQGLSWGLPEALAHQLSFGLLLLAQLSALLWLMLSSGHSGKRV